ncbi:MAG: hypothetical protein Q9174_001717 [Haloplaca sp. 1 TL-2023]
MAAPTPLDMASRHDLEDTFNAMRPHFEDKETEQNWSLREKDTAKLRRITVGNAPDVLKDAYSTGIKSLLEGIIKVVNSLRTTVSASGCDLIQDMAKQETPGMDHTAEIVLPHLVKLCASTKKIAAAKADATVNIVIAHVSYSIFLMKLICSACEDKNVQPRKFATGWLKTLVGKHRENKVVFEKGEGLSLFEKCLKKGLADSNPDVRKLMRPTYWAFIRLWPERSANIISALPEQHRKVLVSEASETSSVPAEAKASMVTASSRNPKEAAKPSIKATIAAKRQAVKTDKQPLTESKASIPPPEPPVRSSTPQTAYKVKQAPTEPKAPISTPQPSAATSGPVLAQRPPLRSLSSAPVRPGRSNRKFMSIKTDIPKASVAPSTGSPILDAVRALSPQKSPILEAVREKSPVFESTTSRRNSVTEACRALKPDWSRPVLQELPVNEPRPLAKMKHYESEKIRVTRQKWAEVEQESLALSPPARRDPISVLRQRMKNRLQRLKSSKAGLQDFRDIQSIIRGSRQVLGDEPELFDDLLFTIFNLMESQEYPFHPDYEPHHLGADHATQLLVTLRVLLAFHTPLLSTYFPRAFCALMAASRHQDDDTHMAIALEDTICDMVDHCDVGNLEDSIDGLLDNLESADFTKFLQPLALGLFAIGQLMSATDPERCCRPFEQEERLGKLAATALMSGFAEIRFAACEFSMVFRHFLTDDERFWELVSPIGKDRARLLVYFYTKQQTEMQLRVEEESWAQAFGSLVV